MNAESKSEIERVFAVHAVRMAPVLREANRVLLEFARAVLQAAEAAKSDITADFARAMKNAPKNGLQAQESLLPKAAGGNEAE